jgi:hypothetical protein
MEPKQEDLVGWLGGNLTDPIKVKAIEADLEKGEASATLSWLKELARKAVTLDEIGTTEGLRKLRGKAAGKGSDDELWPLPDELLRNRREWSKAIKEKNTGAASDLHGGEDLDSKPNTDRGSSHR